MSGMIGYELTQIELVGLIAISLLLIAGLTGIFFRRVRVPYTVRLVLVGLIVALVVQSNFDVADPQIRDQIIPDIILTLLVPPLIFEAAFHLRWDELRQNLRTVLVFAIPGVIITMLIVAGVIYFGVNQYSSCGLETCFSFPAALIFGALIAATDPVAVVALFRKMGVPKRLQVLLEGESLFNDGTAIVLFTLMVELAGSSDLHFQSMVNETLWKFVVVSGGGALIGLFVSLMISWLIDRTNDTTIEVTLTVVAAYGAYLIAEPFHLSGVLAVVVSGLILGNLSVSNVSPTTKVYLNSFWELGAFLANSIVFLLIGLVLDLRDFTQSSTLLDISLAIVAVLIARSISISLLSRFFEAITSVVRRVLIWGGLRGAITLALALSLTENPLTGYERELIQLMTFGVVLFTILIQGSTMGPMINRMGLADRDPLHEIYERRQARAVAAQTAYDHVKSLRGQGLVSEHAWELIGLPLQRQIESRTQAVRDTLHSDRRVEVASLNNAYLEALRAQRNTYNELLGSGVISEDVFSYLVAEIDSALADEEINYGDLLLHRSPDQPPITRMVSAVINPLDIEDTLKTLNIMGIPSTRLHSQTGMNGKESITILAGIEAGQEQEVIRAISNCCAHPPGAGNSAGLPIIPYETIDERGMEIFVFDIEHFEEI